MAIIINLQNQDAVILRSHHVVGRNITDVHLYLEDSDISRHHGYFFWQDNSWLIRDVSTNGIWLNKKQINSGQAEVLKKGDKIRFGSQEHNSWKFSDDSPPCSVLIPKKRHIESILLKEYNSLPVNEPEVEIIKEGHNWTMYQSGESTELKDGQIIFFNDIKWELQLDDLEMDTQLTAKIALLEINHVLLNFKISQDEEHTNLMIEFEDGRKIDFYERTHHYLLLTLARQRYEDEMNGIDSSESGWLDVEVLSKMLGMDQSHINIQVFRARKQLNDQLSNHIDINDLIERRFGSLRLGSEHFKIYRGNKLEASLPLVGQESDETVYILND